MDAAKALDGIKEIVKESILNDFVRDLLADLRSPERDEDGSREWADDVERWLIDEMHGDPECAS